MKEDLREAIREVGGDVFLRSIQEAAATPSGGEQCALIATKLTKRQLLFLDERIRGLQAYAKIVENSEELSLSIPALLSLLVDKYMDEARW